MTMTTLVTAAADRNESAWAELVAEFGPTLRAIGAGFRLTAEECADAEQTVWLLLVAHLGRIRDPERIAGWLTTTMRHECARIVRGRRREQGLAEWMVAPAGESVVDGLIRDERDRTLWRMVDRLPAHQRRLLLALSDESSPSYRDVATAMAIPVGSIGPTRARALGRLKMMLAEEGLDRAA